MHSSCTCTCTFHPLYYIHIDHEEITKSSTYTYLRTTQILLLQTYQDGHVCSFCQRVGEILAKVEYHWSQGEDSQIQRAHKWSLPEKTGRIESTEKRGGRGKGRIHV